MEGLTEQFLKIDVAKFQGLMKIKLNVHANWDCWLTKLIEVPQDCALMLPLWHFVYERLYSDHKIRPPAWVKAWLETRMTTESMTKDELRIWKLVQARKSPFPVSSLTERSVCAAAFSLGAPWHSCDTACYTVCVAAQVLRFPVVMPTYGLL